MRNRDREKIRSGYPVQYLNNRIHDQNLRPTPGHAEPIAQYFFENSTAGVCDISELEYAINGFIA
jgi:hypothetical protein